MAWKSKGFAALVVAGGGLALAELPGYWHSDDLLRFAVFTLLAIFTASWNVTLPGAKGPMSANFLFVLVAAAQLGEAETLALAVLAVVAHSWLHPSGKGWHRFGQMLFDTGSMAIAVRITTLAYHIVLPRFPVVELPLRLALTASAYFIFSTMPFSILESLRERKPLVRSWAQRFLWAFPYHLTGATVSGLLWAVKTALGWQASTLVVPALYLVYRWYAVYLERVERERNEAEELAALHLRTIEALALAIEAKDQAGYNQLQRVQLFCMEIGRELGMSAQELQALLAASLLRDIGKLAVPEHISSKPGALTPEEFEKVKIHPVVGAEILERVRFPYPVVPIVRHHHERWDGGGYPDGIRAEEIPLGARILSVVDCFDALSSDRQYRSAMPVEESIAYIRQEAGKAFDPRVVEVLGHRYEELEREARSRQREEQSTEVRNQREQAEFVQSIAAARAEAQFLFSISQDLTLSIDLEAMLTKLSERLPQAVPFDTLIYYHLDGESLYPLFVNGWERTRFEQLRVPLGQGLSGWAVKEKRTICNGNPAAELGTVGDPAAFTNLRSALVVPVEGAAGVSGALMLCSLNRERYSRDQVRILMAVAARLAFQVENSLRYRKASGDAFIDELTGLHNSRWLVSALRNACREASRENEPFLVLVMDLDGFKSLNDTFGHLKGNEALRGIAAGAQRLIPAPGSFSRMGGDEFVAVLPGVTWDGAIALAEMIQAVTEEVGLGLVGDGRLSCSWGLAAYGQDGVSPEALMAEADHRMYAYKRTKQERMAARLSRLAAGIDGDAEAAKKPIALRDET